MSDKRSRFKQLILETKAMRAWLNNQPEYVRDSIKSDKNKSGDKAFKKKWGFGNDPKSFSDFMHDNLAGGRFQPAVWCLNLPWPLGKPKSAPAKLTVEIDWRQGDKIIIRGLKKILKSFRNTYRIKPDRSRLDFSVLVIKALMLIRARVDAKSIKQRLMEEIRSSSSIGAKESRRKTVEKAIAKARNSEF